MSDDKKSDSGDSRVVKESVDGISKLRPGSDTVKKSVDGIQNLRPEKPPSEKPQNPSDSGDKKD